MFGDMMNYPNGIKRNNQKSSIPNGNRGMSLENDLNLSNQYYRNNNIALIYKKPTPIKATKISYINNCKKINDGFFEMASTTDYNGVYLGYYIDFEAKMTNNLTSFPLSNIHAHQLEHLLAVNNHGGISFLIIRFTKLNLTFLIETNKISDIIKDRKNIPLSLLKERGFIIQEKYEPRLDYLKIVDQIIGGKNEI